MQGLQYLIQRFSEHGTEWPQHSPMLFSPGQQPQNAYLVYCQSAPINKQTPTLLCLPGICELIHSRPYTTDYVLSPQQRCLYLSTQAFMQLFSSDFYFKLTILQALSTSQNAIKTVFE